MENVLVNDAEKYGGKYVATKSFTDKEVICSGDDLNSVHNHAKEKGIDNPVVFFVPKKGISQIY